MSTVLLPVASAAAYPLFCLPHWPFFPSLLQPASSSFSTSGVSQGSVPALYTHFPSELTAFHGFIYQPLANNIPVYVYHRSRRSCVIAYSVPLMAPEPEGGKMPLRRVPSLQRVNCLSPFLHSCTSIAVGSTFKIYTESKCHHLVHCHTEESGPAAASQLLIPRHSCSPWSVLHRGAASQLSSQRFPLLWVCRRASALSLCSSHVPCPPLHLLFLVFGVLSCPGILFGHSREVASLSHPWALLSAVSAVGHHSS